MIKLPRYPKISWLSISSLSISSLTKPRSALLPTPLLPTLLLLILSSSCLKQSQNQPFQALTSTDTYFDDPQYINHDQLNNAKQPWDIASWHNYNIAAVLTRINQDHQPQAQLHILKLDPDHLTRIGSSHNLNGAAARVLIVNDMAMVPLLDEKNPGLFICQLDPDIGCSSTRFVATDSIILDLRAFQFATDDEDLVLSYNRPNGTGTLGKLDLDDPDAKLKLTTNDVFGTVIKPIRLATVDDNTLAVLATDGNLYLMEYDPNADTFHNRGNFQTASIYSLLAVVGSDPNQKHVVAASSISNTILLVKKSRHNGNNTYTSSTYTIDGSRTQTLLSPANSNLLLVGHRNVGQINVLTLNNDGVTENIPISTTRDTTFLALGNFDNRGDKNDIVVIENLKRALGILKKEGNSYTRNLIGTSSYMRKPFTADLNHNGRSDLIVLQPYNNRLAIFYNKNTSLKP